jgi:hypothetical protein
MTRQVCSGCGTRFATGFFRCPRCRAVAPLFADQVKESKLPRITVAGGPSNAGAQPGEPGYVVPAAEVSLVDITGDPGPEAVDFTGGETVVPADALTGQPAGPEAPPAQPVKASRRKAAGGAS